jgi:hypothetical protein
MKKFLGFILLLATSTVLAGQNTEANFRILSGNDSDFNQTRYYMIHDDPRLQFFNLLALDVINEKLPLPAEPYKRDKHYGGWLVDTSGNTCMNTRAFVLIRDSKTEVKMTPAGCTVESGHWDDPYTGEPHTLASTIQIDHVVALKNSYMSGGHQWSQAKRCLYGNYMGNKFHLMSVNGPQNLKKSDHTPARYIPPNKAHVCEFLKNWLHIKLIWSLRITPPEGDAISDIAQDHNCDPESFKVPASEIQQQREYMEQNMDLCSRTPGLKAAGF